MIAVAAGAVVVGVVLVAADPSDPSDAPTGAVADDLATAQSAPEPFVGWTDATLTVGETELFVVIADEPDERVQGLRGVTDLAPYDGMLFRFDAADEWRFTMADTLIPLDIGFYTADGTAVGTASMVPCAAVESECPLYGPDVPFLLALETPAGGLPGGALGAS